MSDQDLYNRARGLLLLGAIFKSTIPDESDEERRELERCVPLVCSWRNPLTQNKRIGWLPRLPSRKSDSRHQAPRYRPPRIARTSCAMDMDTDTRMRTGTSLPVTRPHRTRPLPKPPLLPHILNRPAPTGIFLSILRALSVRRWFAGRTEVHMSPPLS